MYEGRLKVILLLQVTQCQICIGYPPTSPSDLKGPETSKLDWKCFEHNKVDRNELQIRKNLHKGTGTKMTEKMGHFCSCAFMQNFANLEFIPINVIVFKVPSVQF